MAYSDEAGHDLRLEAVLKRFEDAGLSIGLDKYILANRKIEYLGYEVSEDRVQSCGQTKPFNNKSQNRYL